jgi:hypothetical protein
MEEKMKRLEKKKVREREKRIEMRRDCQVRTVTVWRKEEWTKRSTRKTMANSLPEIK